MAISVRSLRRPWRLDHHTLSAFAAELYSTTVAERNASRRYRQLIWRIIIRAIVRSVVVWSVVVWSVVVRAIRVGKQFEYGINTVAAGSGFPVTTVEIQVNHFASLKKNGLNPEMKPSPFH